MDNLLNNTGLLFGFTTGKSFLLSKPINSTAILKFRQFHDLASHHSWIKIQASLALIWNIDFSIVELRIRICFGNPTRTVYFMIVSFSFLQIYKKLVQDSSNP